MAEETQPQFSFAEIDKVFRLAQRRNPAVFNQMDVGSFSRMLNQATGTELFTQGNRGTVMSTLLRANEAVNQILQPASQAVGQFGEDVGGTFGETGARVGRSVGEHLPRTGVDMAAFLTGLALGPATAAGAGLAGLGLTSTFANTVGETGSIPAGVIGAGTLAAMPVAGAIGRRVATDAIVGPLAQKFGANNVPGVAKRLIEEAGLQSALLAEQEIGAQLQSKVVTGEFFNPFTAEHIGEVVAGNIPFFAFDAPRLARGYKIDYSGLQPRIKPVGVGEVFKKDIEGLQPSLWDAQRTLDSDVKKSNVAKFDFINQSRLQNKDERVTKARNEAAEAPTDEADLFEDIVKSEFNKSGASKRGEMLGVQREVGEDFDSLSEPQKEAVRAQWRAKELSAGNVAKFQRVTTQSERFAKSLLERVPGAEMGQNSDGSYFVRLPVEEPKAAVSPELLAGDTFFATIAEQLTMEKPFRLKKDSEGKLPGNQLLEQIKKNVSPLEVRLFGVEKLEDYLKGKKVSVEEFNEWVKNNQPEVEVVKLYVAPKGKRKVDDLEAERSELLHEAETVPDGPGNLEAAHVLLDLAFEARNRGERPAYNPRAVEIAERLVRIEDELGYIGESLVSGSASSRYGRFNPRPPSVLKNMQGVDILVTTKVKQPNRVGFEEESHFPGQQDVAVFMRGYMEGDTFFIHELQSDWGAIKQIKGREGGVKYEADPGVFDSRGEAEQALIKENPFLADYHRLGLKAAIKHALEIGARRIAVSDANTAILTELHHRGAVETSAFVPELKGKVLVSVPSQKLTGRVIKYNDKVGVEFENGRAIAADTTVAGKEVSELLRGVKFNLVTRITTEDGMRFNYDQLLPRILGELTGTKPEKVNFGLHQNASAKNPDLVDFKHTDITGSAFPLGLVKEEIANRGGFTFISKDKLLSELTQLEAEGSDAAELGRASEILLRTPRKEGETIPEVAARETGLKEILLTPTQPDQFLEGVLKFFNRKFELSGIEPSRRAFLSRYALTLAAKFEQRILNKSRLVEALEGPSFASPPLDGVFNGIVGLKTRPAVKGELDILRFMWDAAHEYSHQIEFAGTASPEKDAEIGSVQHYREAFKWAKELSTDEKVATLNTFIRHVIPDIKGEFDYKAELIKKAGAENRPDVEASEFLADVAGLIAMGATSADSRVLFKELITLGNKQTADFVLSQLRDLSQSVHSVVDYLAMDLVTTRGLTQKRADDVTAAAERVVENITKMLATRDEVAARVSAFSSLIDRVGTTAADLPPTASLAQVRRFFKRMSQFEPPAAESPDFSKLIDEMEEHVVPTPSVGGKRLKVWEYLYPLTQLARSYPEIKPMADLILDFHAISANRTASMWDLFADPKTGKFDKERLKKVSNVNRIEGKAFSYAALLQQVLEKRLEGTELTTLLREKFPSITPEQVATVDLSLAQSGEIAEAAGRMLVRANVHSVASKIALSAMARNPGLKPTRAYEVGMAFADGYLGKEFAQRVQVARKLQAELPEDIFKAGDTIVRAALEPHQELAKTFEDRPWYFSEVRPGEWIVAWKEQGKKRQLWDFRSRQEAEAKLQSLLAQQGKGKQFEYIKGFNKNDSAERWRGLQRPTVEALIKADKAVYDAVMADLKGKVDPDTLLMIQNEFQPGDGVMRIVTPPYMQERALVGGRERLNMGEQLMLYIDAVSYGTSKRFVKQQQQLLMQDTNLKSNPQLANVVNRHFNSVVDPPAKEWTRMKNFIFLNYLGFNLSSSLIEFTQNFVTGVPELLRQGASFGQAYRYMMRGAKEVGQAYRKRGVNIKGQLDYGDPEINNMIEILENDRVIERGWIQELFAIEDELAVTKRNLVAGNGKVVQAKELLSNVGYHTMKFARDLYATSVRFNTRSAAIAGYRYAREVQGKDHDGGIQFARDYVRVTNFGGGRANRPTVIAGLGKAQGAAGVMYALSGYTYNLLSFMARLGKEAISSSVPKAERAAAFRAFATMLGTQGVLGGVMGMPLVGGVMALLEQVFPDVEVKKNLREALVELGGEDEDTGRLIADGAMSGLFNVAVPSADIGSRFQLGSFLGVNPYEGFSFGNVFGPGVSMVENYLKGSQEILQGDLMKGTEYMIPAGTRGLLRLVNDGGDIRDSQERLIFTPTPAERTLMAVGFKPKRLNQYYEEQAIKLRTEERETERLRDFHIELARLLLQGRHSEVRQRLIEEEQRTPGYEARSGLGSVAEIAQQMVIPRDPSRGGLRTTVDERAGVRRLFQPIEQPREVDRLVERKVMEQAVGLPGGGRITGRSLREAVMVDQLVSQGLSRDQARLLLQRRLRPVDPILR